MFKINFLFYKTISYHRTVGQRKITNNDRNIFHVTSRKQRIYVTNRE
jgi:hypothetical protein